MYDEQLGATIMAPLGKFWSRILAPKVEAVKIEAPKFDLGTPVYKAPVFNVGTPLVKPLAFDLGAPVAATAYPVPKPKPVTAPIAPTIAPLPAPVKAGMGQWAMPAMIGGGVLLLIMMATQKPKKGKR